MSELPPRTSPVRPSVRASRKRHNRVRALSLGAIVLPLVCTLALGCLIVVAQAAGVSPLPPEIAASLESLAASIGLIEQPPSVPATRTTAPQLVYIATPAPRTPSAPEPAVTQTAMPQPAVATENPTDVAPETATVTATRAAEERPAATATPPITGTATPTATLGQTLTPVAGASETATDKPTHTPSRTPTMTPTTSAATNTTAPTSAATATEATSSTPTKTSVPPSETPPSSCNATENSSYENTLLDLINQERQSQGLTAYTLSGQLRSAARGHSQDMACNDYFSHTGLDGSSVGDRVEAEGYSWSWVGENIFATSVSSSASAQQAFDAWMNSSGHRANILSEHFTEVGIGYAYDSDSTYGSYYTAVFARP